MEVVGTWKPKYEIGYRWTNKQGNDCEIIEIVSEEEKYVVQVIVDANKGFTYLTDEEGIEEDIADEQ